MSRKMTVYDHIFWIIMISVCLLCDVSLGMKILVVALYALDLAQMDEMIECVLRVFCGFICAIISYNILPSSSFILMAYTAIQVWVLHDALTESNKFYESLDEKNRLR